MKHKILVFMPSIEGGGVEKNFFLVCNYLVNKVKTLKKSESNIVVRCTAITLKGAQCKRNASSGSTFCWQHKK